LWTLGLPVPSQVFLADGKAEPLAWLAAWPVSLAGVPPLLPASPPAWPISLVGVPVSLLARLFASMLVARAALWSGHVAGCASFLPGVVF